MIFYNGIKGGWLTSSSFRHGRRPLAFLTSYGTHRGTPKAPPCQKALFLDSGAFSVWKSGKIVALPDYIDYLREHVSRIAVYAALDVIGDPEGSFRNYMKMREAGLDPLPCFHHGEPFEWLDKYVEAGATYIGLGGIAKCLPSVRHAFFRSVFTRYPDPERVGFHGFGLADVDLWKAYPFRSCDSTTAVMRGSMRVILTPFGNLECNSKRARRRSPGDAVDRLHTWVESVGGDLSVAYDTTASGDYECGYLTALALDVIAESLPTSVYKPAVKGFTF